MEPSLSSAAWLTRCAALSKCDVVEESDGDLMGDGVNIAARLEGIAARHHLSGRASVLAYAAYGYFVMGQAEISLGHCEQSIAHIRQAFALSPRDPVAGAWHTILGASEICLGRLDAAIGEFKRGITQVIAPFFPTLFWRELRPRGGTTPRRNLLWQRRVV